MIDKKAVPTKFLWVDLEMTGLNSDSDLILEVAVEITDSNLETLESYEATVKHNRSIVAKKMQENIWWKDFPENRDDFLDKLDDGKPLNVIEKELIEIIDKNFGQEPAILAGNSIHSDRAFIKKWMPELELKLHYRMIDVSSWKIIMQSMYGLNFEKPEVHRAYEDIQASIAELQYYLEWFKENGSRDT